LSEGVDSFEGVLETLDFARSVGIDNVVFRQLMQTGPDQTPESPVVRYSDENRISLGPILDRVVESGRFTFVRQVVGYYYYVEVWRGSGIDIVFEQADLGHLELTKARTPGFVNEMVFHPDGRLASTWQPWDGVLGPPRYRSQPG
jgi:hypothetical protein